MENIIVAKFQNLQNSNAGLNKLKDLDQLGDIVIYNLALISKKELNKFEVIYHDGPDTEDLPADGAVVGSLVGMVGGPLGMAVGMLTGATAGALDEDDSEGFSNAVLEKVTQKLEIGEYAIIADMVEDAESSSIVNSYIKPFATSVTRTELDDAYDIYDRKQWEEYDKEIEDEEKQFKAARDEDKAVIKARIDRLKAKRTERIKKFKDKREKIKKQLHEKIENLNKKISSANDKMKRRFNAHKEELEKKLDKWSADATWAYMI